MKDYIHKSGNCNGLSIDGTSFGDGVEVGIKIGREDGHSGGLRAPCGKADAPEIALAVLTQAGWNADDEEMRDILCGLNDYLYEQEVERQARQERESEISKIAGAIPPSVHQKPFSNGMAETLYENGLRVVKE